MEAPELQTPDQRAAPGGACSRSPGPRGDEASAPPDHDPVQVTGASGAAGRAEDDAAPGDPPALPPLSAPAGPGAGGRAGRHVRGLRPPPVRTRRRSRPPPPPRFPPRAAGGGGGRGEEKGNNLLRKVNKASCVSILQNFQSLKKKNNIFSPFHQVLLFYLNFETFKNF